MSNATRQFVAMPLFLNLKHQKLNYVDALTYVAIRSFDDPSRPYCYPSYENVMQLSGLKRTFLSMSVARLEKAGLFKVDHSTRRGQANRYYFDKLEHFERIPYEIFDAFDLNSVEKAMLLCLRQFFIQDLFISTGNVKEIAAFLGLTYNIIYPILKRLKVKGYIEDYPGVKGQSTKWLQLTKSIDWVYDYSNGSQASAKAPIKFMM
jgi:DNA-binding MarR family transcriptional regulator